jgi:hypothetical protein
MGLVNLERLDASGLVWAQRMVRHHHYRRSAVPTRACPEGWAVKLPGVGVVGCMIVGRPQATLCRPWYGSVEDARTGRCEVTRWAVLNLARVWLDPLVQVGGWLCEQRWLPGYTDRRGEFRSTLASDALRGLAARVGFEYLLVRPPVFLEEPYEVRWLLSYCDSRQHRGVIYRAAGFELYRTNAEGLQTWRLPLRPLTAAEHAAIAQASAACPRARRFRSERERERAQLSLAGWEAAA